MSAALLACSWLLMAGRTFCMWLLSSGFDDSAGCSPDCYCCQPSIQLPRRWLL